MKVIRSTVKLLVLPGKRELVTDKDKHRMSFSLFTPCLFHSDSEAYRSLGASYTSDVVSSISTFYAAETGSNLTSVEIESQFEVEDEGSALRFQIPVLVLLLSTFMGASMVL